MEKEELVHLLGRLLNDDGDAWRDLVEAYSGILFAVARRTFAAYGFEAGAQDFEDAVAEVWKNLLDHDRRLIRQSLQRGNILAMLVVLTRHRAVDIMRRRKIMTVPLTDHLASENAQDNHNASGIDLPQFRLEILDGLAPREKTCIQLFFLQRKKYREIEALTGIPQNSVGPTIVRGLEKLRKALLKETARE